MTTPSLAARSSTGPRTCPRLGAQGEEGARTEPILYPSFENQCWAGPQPTTILLTDQATLCLCPAHRSCARLLAARPAEQVRPASPPARPAFHQPASLLDVEPDDELDAEPLPSPRRQTRTQWGWIGAGLIFMSSLLCGGFFAAYIGWQMVSSDLLAPLPGGVDTVAAAPTAPPAQLYFVVTATSEPVIVVNPPPQQQMDPAPQSLPNDPARYPAAVTPTPNGLSAATDLQPQGSGGIDQVVVLPPQAVAPPPSMAATDTPVFDMQLAIPTRRPTPVLDIPTSTPAPQLLEPSATPVPFVGPPLVLFSAADSALIAGECTMVRWTVENVRAVYYENLGVNGQGERRECVRDKPGEYVLTVVLPSGQTQLYTTTVELIIPTNTPMPTPTFTDVPPPTPTWTPEAPPATPTPNVTYGVSLQAASNRFECAVGDTCTVDVYVTNSGTAIDNLTVRVTEAGPWYGRLCRMDGVCGDKSLTLVNMGPGNSAVLRFTVTVASPTDFRESAYRLQAVSDGSGQTTGSGAVSVLVVAK